MKIRTKRIYAPKARSDGRRVLIDRLWPRGLTKADARVDFWARAVAPSNELRRWYQHTPETQLNNAAALREYLEART